MDYKKEVIRIVELIFEMPFSEILLVLKEADSCDPIILPGESIKR